MTRLLAIDVGTNSTLHLCADVTGGKVKVVETGITGNRLGIDLDENSRIGDKLLELNRKILLELIEKGRELNCKKIGAVGTHALRRASNQQDFIVMADRLGLNVEIISDKDEAILAWRGVFGISESDRQIGLLDIGGGSTELSIGRGSKPEWSSSMPCGAVILARQFFHHDPPLTEEVEPAVQDVRRRFSQWKNTLSGKEELVGIAGTITALATIEQGITKYEPGQVEGLSIGAECIRKWRESLLNMTLTERESIPGMPQARAGSIHAGALILSEILNILNKDCIKVSVRGVLWGLAMKLAVDI